MKRLLHFLFGLLLSAPVGIAGLYLIELYGLRSGLLFTGSVLCLYIVVIDWLMETPHQKPGRLTSTLECD